MSIRDHAQELPHRFYNGLHELISDGIYDARKLRGNSWKDFYGSIEECTYTLLGYYHDASRNSEDREEIIQDSEKTVDELLQEIERRGEIFLHRREVIPPTRKEDEQLFFSLERMIETFLILAQYSPQPSEVMTRSKNLFALEKRFFQENTHHFLQTRELLRIFLQRSAQYYEQHVNDQNQQRRATTSESPFLTLCAMHIENLWSLCVSPDEYLETLFALERILEKTTVVASDVTRIGRIKTEMFDKAVPRNKRGGSEGDLLMALFEYVHYLQVHYLEHPDRNGKTEGWQHIPPKVLELATRIKESATTFFEDVGNGAPYSAYDHLHLSSFMRYVGETRVRIETSDEQGKDVPMMIGVTNALKELEVRIQQREIDQIQKRAKL